MAIRNEACWHTSFSRQSNERIPVPYMYKRRILVLCVCLSALCAYSQQINPPQIQWQRSFGGSGQDSTPRVRQTSDGGFIVGTYSDSGVDGNKTSPNFGNEDYWVVRLDRDGTKLWDKSFGGTNDDTPLSIVQTPDGGFLVAGETWGIFILSYPDLWVVRLDSEGNKLWDRLVGGDSFDVGGILQQTTDGGLILGGTSQSTPSRDKSSPNFGRSDF